MDIWQLLEIAPTPDTKLIKRAYAKKLKVTRPDENPQGFQDLHQAYKTALHQAAYWDYRDDDHQDDNYGEDTDNAPPETEVSVTQALAPTEDLHNQAATHEIAVNPFQVEGERLLGLAELLLASNDAEQNNPRSWAFIIESPFILEDHFNWRLGLELLQMIHQHQVNHSSTVAKWVNRDVLDYLNSIFNWNENRQHLLRALGDEYAPLLDKIQDPISEAELEWKDKIRGGKSLILQDATSADKNLPLATHWQRFAAGFIDLFVLISVIGLMMSDNKDFPVLMGFLGLSLMYFLVFESSELKVSLGKRLMKLQVVDMNSEHIKIGRNLIRLICFIGYMFAFSIVTALIAIPLPFVAIGAFLYFIYTLIKPITPYDRWSKTRIVRIQ